MQRWERSLRSLAGAAAGGIAKAVLAHRLRHATEHGERVAIVSDELALTCGYFGSVVSDCFRCRNGPRSEQGVKVAVPR
jgi:hypothetical protein